MYLIKDSSSYQEIALLNASFEFDRYQKDHSCVFKQNDSNYDEDLSIEKYIYYKGEQYTFIGSLYKTILSNENGSNIIDILRDSYFAIVYKKSRCKDDK